MTKNGITNPKKDKKEWKKLVPRKRKIEKTWKAKDIFKQECVSFHSRSYNFLPAHISSVEALSPLNEMSRC